MTARPPKHYAPEAAHVLRLADRRPVAAFEDGRWAPTEGADELEQHVLARTRNDWTPDMVADALNLAHCMRPMIGQRGAALPENVPTEAMATWCKHLAERLEHLAEQVVHGGKWQDVLHEETEKDADASDKRPPWRNVATAHLWAIVDRAVQHRDADNAAMVVSELERLAAWHRGYAAGLMQADRERPPQDEQRQQDEPATPPVFFDPRTQAWYAVLPDGRTTPMPPE